MKPAFIELETEVARLAQQALAGQPLCQIWAEQDRVLFRLGDGRSGDVEVLINWDVTPTADEKARKAPEAPHVCPQCPSQP